MPSRVIPFDRARRPANPPGGLGERVFVVLLAALLAAMVYVTPMQRVLDVLFIVTFFYWALIHHEVHRTAYFRKNWGLLILLIALFAFLNPWGAALLAVIGLLYWLCVLRPLAQPTSFVKVHFLTDLIALGLLTIGGMLLWSVARFALVLADGLLDAASAGMITDALAYWLFLVKILMGLALLWSLGHGLFGARPHLPFVSRQVIYWA